MKRLDVDEMLEEIPHEKLLEWQAYDDLEPFGEERADFRAAHIVQTLVNLARDPVVYPGGFPLSDFLLGFGDQQRTSTIAAMPKQTVEMQEKMIDSWISGHNARIREGTTK
jgi:hypothetical protein